MQTEEVFNILVSLDAILDTRIATIAKFDEALATQVLLNQYYERRSDYFEGIEKSLFDRLYKARDAQTLALAQVTNIFFVIKDILYAIIKKSIQTPYVKDIRITINTYPYELEADTLQWICKAVYFQTNQLCVIDTVHLSDTELTPQVVKDQYTILVRYEYDNWLEVNTENFKKCPIPSVELFVPAISFTYNLNEQALNDVITQVERNPFEQLQFGLAPFINLQPIDVIAFSAYHPKKILKVLESMMKWKKNILLKITRKGYWIPRLVIFKYVF